MQGVRNNIVRLQDELGQVAGIDPLYDRYRVGYIMACMDLLNIDFEE